MKLSNKICGVALVAITGAAVLGQASFAADKDPDTANMDGKVRFTRTTTGTNSVSKPDSTDSFITNITVNPVEDFGIVAVTPLEFGTHEALGGTAERVYFAEPFIANAGNADEYPVENFVKFRDTRATLNHKYQLSAKLNQQFTANVDGGQTKLKGATLTFDKLHLASIEDADVRPQNPEFATTPVLKEDNGSQVFFKNVSEGAGVGDYELTFGKVDANTDKEAIRLDIPTSTEIMKLEYTAVVEWTLASVQ